jgi:hypothetical protein
MANYLLRVAEAGATGRPAAVTLPAIPPAPLPPALGMYLPLTPVDGTARQLQTEGEPAGAGHPASPPAGLVERASPPVPHRAAPRSVRARAASSPEPPSGAPRPSQPSAWEQGPARTIPSRRTAAAPPIRAPRGLRQAAGLLWMRPEPPMHPEPLLAGAAPHGPPASPAPMQGKPLPAPEVEADNPAPQTRPSGPNTASRSPGSQYAASRVATKARSEGTGLLGQKLSHARTPSWAQPESPMPRTLTPGDGPSGAIVPESQSAAISLRSSPVAPRRRTQLSIGRVDVQVRNTVPASRPPAPRVIPPVTADPLTARYLDRFRLLPS